MKKRTSKVDEERYTETICLIGLRRSYLHVNGQCAHILSNKTQNTFNRMNNKNDETSVDDDGTNKEPQELVQCSVCLRRMRQEVFVKHPNLCRKIPTNKRNVHVFDMTEYRSVRTGDKIIPIRKLSPINTNKPSNTIVRPSQTRSAKRDRRSDTLIPPVIDNFCTYIYLLLQKSTTCLRKY